jgi:hypothetical protein
MGVKGLRAYLAEHKTMYMKNTFSYRRQWTDAAAKKFALVFDNAAFDTILKVEGYHDGVNVSRGGVLTQVSPPSGCAR